MHFSQYNVATHANNINIVLYTYICAIVIIIYLCMYVQLFKLLSFAKYYLQLDLSSSCEERTLWIIPETLQMRFEQCQSLLLRDFR